MVVCPHIVVVHPVVTAVGKYNRAEGGEKSLKRQDGPVLICEGEWRRANPVVTREANVAVP